MQGVERLRAHLSDIRSLLSEFGLIIPKGVSAFKCRVVEILDDAENDKQSPVPGIDSLRSIKPVNSLFD